MLSGFKGTEEQTIVYFKEWGGREFTWAWFLSSLSSCAWFLWAVAFPTVCLTSKRESGFWRVESSCSNFYPMAPNFSHPIILVINYHPPPPHTHTHTHFPVFLLLLHKKSNGPSLAIRPPHLHWLAVRTLLTLITVCSLTYFRIVPESPRWAFLNSSTKQGTNEAQGLLERFVNEDQRQSSKYRNCLTMWGHFHFPAEAKTRDRWFTFLRRKKQRKITVVLGVAW